MPHAFSIRPLAHQDAEAIYTVALESWRLTYKDIFTEAFILHFVDQNSDECHTVFFQTNVTFSHFRIVTFQMNVTFTFFRILTPRLLGKLLRNYR